MKRIIFIVFLYFGFQVYAQNVQSPSKSIKIDFKLDEKGKSSYTVLYKNKIVVSSSYLGSKLKDGRNLDSNFSIDSIGIKLVNETWQPVLGEQSNIKNNYYEMIVELSQKAAFVQYLFYI